MRGVSSFLCFLGNSLGRKQEKESILESVNSRCLALWPVPHCGAAPTCRCPQEEVWWLLCMEKSKGGRFFGMCRMMHSLTSTHRFRTAGCIYLCVSRASIVVYAMVRCDASSRPRPILKSIGLLTHYHVKALRFSACALCVLAGSSPQSTFFLHGDTKHSGVA